MGAKHIPQRKCLSCGEMKDKRDLIRIVRSKEGVVSVDSTGKLSGRGAYMCRDASCIAKGKKARRIERAFSCQVDSSVYETLENLPGLNTGEINKENRNTEKSREHPPDGGGTPG